MNRADFHRLILLLSLCASLAACGGGGGGGGGGKVIQPPTVTPGAGAARLNGHYAFLFSGFFHGYFTGIGSFVADGAGNISAGLVDTNGTGAVTTDGSFTGSYVIGADGTGTMTLTYGGGATVSYALAMSVNGDGRFIQYVASGVQGSGLIRWQDPNAFSAAKLSGSYAFGIAGLDGPSARRLALAGQFQADGIASFTAGTADGNDDGTPLSNETLAGSYAVAADGRGTATLTVAGLGTLNAALYVISSKEFFLMQIDSVPAGNPLLAGDVLQSSAPFSGASLNGNAVLQASGLSGTAAEAVLGLATVSVPGTLALSEDTNSGGTLGTQNESLAYTVAANGRVTTTGASDAPVLYLAGPNQGFVVFAGSGVVAGRIDAQAPGPFSDASLTGDLAGGSVTLAAPGTVEADALTADGAGNLTINFSSSDGTALLQGTRPLTYSLTANGRATLAQQGAGAGVLYMVSPSEVLILGAGSPSLASFEP